LKNSSTVNYDEKKVNSLSWLCFKHEHFRDAIVKCNAIVRDFIEAQKYELANDAIALINTRIVMKHQKAASDTDMDENAFMRERSNWMREFNSWTLFITALKTFQAWKLEHLNMDRILGLQHQQQHLSSSLQVQNLISESAKAFQLQEQRKREELMKANEERYANEASKQGEQMLQFEHGWLLDLEDEEDISSSEVSRHDQLAALRTLCLSIVIKNLHELYYMRGDYGRCAQLSVTLANEEFLLYKSITPKDMKELLSSFATSYAMKMQQHKQ